MKAEVVAGWLFEAADEATKDSPLRAEPKGPPAEIWATLTPEQQAIAMAFARRAYTAGLRRAQELAKEHATATCCHECGECGGEGYDVEDSGEDCTQCGGKGDRMDKVAVDFDAFDQAIDAEVAKGRS